MGTSLRWYDGFGMADIFETRTLAPFGVELNADLSGPLSPEQQAAFAAKNPGH